MGRAGWIILIPAWVLLSACGTSYSAPGKAEIWKTAFWFWHGSARDEGWMKDPVDALYVQVGTLREVPLEPGLDWPGELPRAREYWMVIRNELPWTPPPARASAITRAVRRLWLDGQAAGRPLAGLQLDIDAPTGKLREYAAFLREVRKGLPSGAQLSITALLDWFRDGTEVAQVIREVDEFVPQFYDLGPGYQREPAIAARVDARRWGPAFNRYGKRFRVGISTFGRSRLAAKDASASFYGDVAPIDFAGNPAFQVQARRNDARELVLAYRAVRSTRVSYTRFQPGDAMEFVLPTLETVHSSVEEVRRMGDRAAGVIFFRWPTGSDHLTLQPGEALLPEARREPRVHTVDGRCAAVECVNLFLESGSPLAERPLRYRIRSSTELEYFLPKQKLDVRMTGPAEVELRLPPYCGRGRLYLGRAISREPAQFTVEELP